MQYEGSPLVKIGLYDTLKLNMEVFICIGEPLDPIILRPPGESEDLSLYNEVNRVIKILHREGYLYIRTKN